MKHNSDKNSVALWLNLFYVDFTKELIDIESKYDKDLIYYHETFTTIAKN